MNIKSLIGRYFVAAGLFVNIGLLGVLLLSFLWLDRSPQMALYALGGYLESRPEQPLVPFGRYLKDAFAPEYQVFDSFHVPVFSGSRTLSFSWQTYDKQRKPVGQNRGFYSKLQAGRIVTVSSEQELLKAVRSAQAGDLIDIAAGTYRFEGHSIPVLRSGSQSAPIYLRANQLGDVTLEFKMLEGFHIQAPFWVFENLKIVGTCDRDSQCEHAFHVVGKGHAFVLRNSHLSDFNAPLKVNGLPTKAGVKYPDNGLLEYNIIANTRPRDTGNPVTLLNINNVNDWVVRGNLVSDFSKLHSNKLSYGAFMKGNGRRGVFERNLIYCERNVPADDGVRVGLSFGGGGTGAQFCRDGGCPAEHTSGIIRNNIILNCSKDVGIYLNKSADTQVYNNLLYNSLGIDVRFPVSSAVIRNNVVAGRIKSRDGGLVEESNNWIEKNCFTPQGNNCAFDDVFKRLGAGDLRLVDVDNPVWGQGVRIQGGTEDFCGNPRSASGAVDIGPIEYSGGLGCLEPQ